VDGKVLRLGLGLQLRGLFAHHLKLFVEFELALLLLHFFLGLLLLLYHHLRSAQFELLPQLIVLLAHELLQLGLLMFLLLLFLLLLLLLFLLFFGFMFLKQLLLLFVI